MTHTVLIVDDNQELRELMSLRLELSGFPSLQSSNGVEALEMIKSHDIGIVVSDLKMPLMGGIELLRSVRDLGGEQLFVFVSGEIEREQAKEAAQLGVFEFVEKGSCDSWLDVMKNAQNFLNRDIKVLGIS